MQQPISRAKLLFFNEQIIIKEGQAVEDVEFELQTNVLILIQS